MLFTLDDMWTIREECIAALSERSSVHVRGIDLDSQTRCAHYRGPTDIIAIKMKCCGQYYPCKDCHAELTDHGIQIWPENDWYLQAVRCGACGAELTIHEYMRCESCCPVCLAEFNPRCSNQPPFLFSSPGTISSQIRFVPIESSNSRNAFF